MKSLPSLVAIGTVLSATCYAQTCPGPKTRQVTIGGNTIDGYVSLQHRPLKSAQVRLRSSGKVTWIGSTKDDGSFHIHDLRRGIYSLTVNGWGSAIIRINPDLTKSSGQTIYYSLLLVDKECIATLRVMN